jgi:hypothetical protein
MIRSWKKLYPEPELLKTDAAPQHFSGATILFDLYMVKNLPAKIFFPNMADNVALNSFSSEIESTYS